MPEPEKKKHGWKILLALGIVAYFFIAARPMEREFSMSPVWALDLGADVVPASALPADVRPFDIAGRYGYFSADGRLLKSAPVKGDAVISGSLYAEYSPDADSTAFYAPDGKRAFAVSAPGYPYFASGRLFFANPDGNGISEYSATGSPLWSRDSSSIATCFAANASVAVMGGLDGRLVALASDGSLLQDFSPGGSRVSIILGCAVSSDSSMIALVSGIDRQRFMLLERKGGGYRVAYHSYLDTDFRRRVFVEFSEDGRYVFYEGDARLSVFEIGTGETRSLPLSGRPMAVKSSARDGLFIILSTGQDEGRIQVVRAPSTVLLDSSFPGSEFFLDRDGSSVFLGSRDRAMRIDMGYL